jgi:hypothetical protein
MLVSEAAFSQRRSRSRIAAECDASGIAALLRQTGSALSQRRSFKTSSIVFFHGPAFRADNSTETRRLPQPRMGSLHRGAA